VDPAAGDALLALCDEATDAWITHPDNGGFIWPGHPDSSDGWPMTPRSSCLEGIIVRALRGRPELLPFCRGYARGQAWTWTFKHQDGNNNSIPGSRDPGYCYSMLAAAIASSTDTTERATLAAFALECVDYARNTVSADGRFYVNFGAPTADPTGAAGPRFTPGCVSQTFTNAHLGHGLVRLWQVLSADPALAATHAAALDAVAALVVTLADGYVLAYLPGRPTMPVAWRGARYYDAAPSVVTTAPWPNEPVPPVGTKVRDYGFEEGSVFWERAPADSWAYARTGVARYRDVASDIFAAAHGDDTLDFRPQGFWYDPDYRSGNGQKHFNEATRRASETLVYLDGRTR
jgi:hypothetical protein